MRLSLRLLALSLATLAVLLGLYVSRPGGSGVEASLIGEQLDHRVAATLQDLGPGETVSVIVRLKEQADVSDIRPAGRDARHQELIGRLMVMAESSQGNVRRMLAAEELQGEVDSITPYWIFNGFAVTATREVILELAARPEVLSISPDSPIDGPSNPLGLEGDSTPPEANLETINVPALWNLGIRGAGIVVASLDTGVDVTHPDLASRWRGGTNSWFDPWNEHPDTPTDVDGHGTWTMGVIVGGDAGGTDIGVAPDAQWIAAKIFDDSGTATVSKIHAAFQWILDPDGDPSTADAPHVVNNSWSFMVPGCDLEFQQDIAALRAASILTVFAAGNTGPQASTSVSPANYPGALAVGATSNTDALYADSGRGPSACGEAESIYPELVAPGVIIRTSDPLGGYAFPTGTSLATPHVAGAAALLSGAFPGLAVEQVEEALMDTALDLGTPGPDNDFGYGRIDVSAAHERLDRQLNGALGDVNCDGAVAMTDALLIARLVSGLIPQLACPAAADVDGNGNVMMTDALLVARLTLGLP